MKMPGIGKSSPKKQLELWGLLWSYTFGSVWLLAIISNFFSTGIFYFPDFAVPLAFITLLEIYFSVRVGMSFIEVCKEILESRKNRCSNSSISLNSESLIILFLTLVPYAVVIIFYGDSIRRVFQVLHFSAFIPASIIVLWTIFNWLFIERPWKSDNEKPKDRNEPSEVYVKTREPSVNSLVTTLKVTAFAWSTWYWIVFMCLRLGYAYSWDWKRPENAVYYAFLALVQVLLTGILAITATKVYRAYFKGFKRRRQAELCSSQRCKADLFRADCIFCEKKAFPLTSVSFGLLAATVLPLASVGACGIPNDTGPIEIMRAAAIIIAAALVLWSIGCWLWNR